MKRRLGQGLMFMTACSLVDSDLKALIKWAEGRTDVDELVDLIFSTDDREYYVIMGKSFLRDNGIPF